MFLSRQVIPVTTDENGDAVVHSGVVNGKIVEIGYIKDGINGFAAGVDFDIETEITAQKLWDEDDVNASKAVRPLITSYDTLGTELVVNTEDAVYQPIAVVDERVKFTVDDGGDSKIGTFHIVVEGTISN